MSHNSSAMEVGDYLAIMRRRKIHLFAPFIIILLASLAAAFALPPVYQSKATILVEEQGIPADFVQSTVTGYVQERIQALTQRLLTDQNLWEIAERLNLYPGERSPDNRPEIVEGMRQNITTEIQASEGGAPGSGKPTIVSLSFTISYNADNPETAHIVTNELTKLYLEENLKERTQQSEEVTRFLKQEAERYRVQIAEMEKKLAAFKQANVEQLPENTNLNLRLVDQANAEISQVEDRIQSLEQQMAYLQSQLSMMDPNLPIASAQGIKPLSPIQQLRTLQAQLLEARQKYSQEHRDVKSLKSQISALEQMLKGNQGSPRGIQDKQLFAPDNPAYISLQAQLESTKASLNLTRQERGRLKQKLAEYENRLLKAPAVERDYLNLTRDYDTAVKNYQDVQQKLQKAELARQMEEEAKGERFALIGPADLPTSPIKPNRPVIVFLGLVLALGGGIGSVSAAEFFDQTVRGLRGVSAILHAPPLAAIPYIETPKDIARKRKRRLEMGFLILLIVTLGLILADYFMPLDQLWTETIKESGETLSNQKISN